MLLGEDALATKMQQFEQLRADYFTFRESIDQRAEAEYTAKITPILDQIKTIVERVGKEEGYGLIVDSAALAVVYVDPDFDLTNDVLAALARGDDE
jgi:Skp family chaperone for outer membrane proteins